MELYLAATVSGCQSLYDVFLKKEKDGKDPNGDMHVVTASSILGITPDAWLVLKESKKEADRKQGRKRTYHAIKNKPNKKAKFEFPDDDENSVSMLSAE